MKILMVLTSHDKLGETGKKTGFWLEEFAAPYYVFRDAGATVTLASPKGGQPPLDPKSDEPGAQTEATRRFKSDEEAKQALAHTRILSSMDADTFDAVFYPGGHGPLWDLAEDRASISPVGARHDLERSKAAIGKGKQGRGSRKGRQDRHKTEPQGYRALRCRVLAGCGQQEQGKDLSWRRPSPQRHHRHRPSHPVIRHRPPPRILPDLLLRAIQKLRPSLRRHRRIAE